MNGCLLRVLCASVVGFETDSTCAEVSRVSFAFLWPHEPDQQPTQLNLVLEWFTDITRRGPTSRRWRGWRAQLESSR
jgi:hypothetical protein